MASPASALRYRGPIVDPAAKTRHCAFMLLASGVLASCAPDEVQQRALARYAFLYGESLLLWAQRWRNQLKRDPATAVGAQAAKPAVDTLAAVVLPTLGVR